VRQSEYKIEKEFSIKRYVRLHKQFRVLLEILLTPVERQALRHNARFVLNPDQSDSNSSAEEDLDILN
jgi:hypothetical protein